MTRASDTASIAARAAFSGAHLTAWTTACQRLQHAGYGAAVPRAYRTASLEIATQIDPDTAVAFARSVSLVAIKARPRTAALFCNVAGGLARRLTAPNAFARWTSQIETLSKTATDAVWPLLERSEQIFARVDLDAYLAWVQTGLRLAASDAAKRAAFFTLQSAEAQQLLERQAGTLTFPDFETRLRVEMRALFGVAPPLREARPDALNAVRHRSSFAGGIVQLPSRYANVKGAEAQTFRAAVAHIGAHMTYGRGKFPVGQLKPLQIAVVSLIEDARVELLAMRQMPGLARLWRPLHSAPPEGARTATSLFARLARALIDPDFAPSDGWVKKGRGLFFAASDHWDDPGISRHIGNLLGNDLGQLRVQFNAKNYVVAPAYRDDNMGLWDLPDPPDAEPENTLSVETQDFRRPEPGESGDRRDKPPDPDDAGENERVRPKRVDSRDGTVVAHVPEYDHTAGIERANWVTVRDYAPAPGDPLFWTRLRERHGALADRAERLARAASVGQRHRLRRQLEGDKLDLSAAVEAAIEFRTGQMPSPAVYENKSPPVRSIATHVLLDTSQSTADVVPGTGKTVLEIERDAAALLALAMDRLGDPLAVSAFASAGREDLRMVPVKRFGEPLGLLSGMAFSGLRPGYSTRMGAALRHAGAALATVRAHRKLLLVVTDGEPSDIDVPDRAYLVADARRAVQSLRAEGIDCFCLALGSGSLEEPAQIFGRRGYAKVSHIETLPEKLHALYMLMTR